MKRNIEYKTKQKDIIINIIKNLKHKFTVKDIYDSISNEVGLTTIYRVVDKLVEDNILKKYLSNDNVVYYQYLEKCSKQNHFYLKCEKCNNIFHIDCDCINELSGHILNEHKFKANNKNIIIEGVCERCTGMD